MSLLLLCCGVAAADVAYLVPVACTQHDERCDDARVSTGSDGIAIVDASQATHVFRREAILKSLDPEPVCARDTIALDRARLVAVGKQRIRHFFALPLDRAQNVPWVVFALDLARGQVVKLAQYYGSAVLDFRLSPTEEYLSFVVTGRGSPCDIGFSSVLLDSKTGTDVGQNCGVNLPQAKSGLRYSIGCPHWLTDSTIAYKLDYWQCEQGRTVDVNDLPRTMVCTVSRSKRLPHEEEGGDPP
jgi:hypothetical protein